MIRAVYICGDIVGAPGGAGQVTAQEVQVLQGLYGADQVQVFQLDDVRPAPYAALDVPFIHDRFALSKVARLCEKQGFPQHVHIYSGSYSELTRYLVNHGVKVSHTSPSHDRNLSMKERGPAYYLPHIDIPELWQEHSEGLRLADLVIVPGEAPRRFLESEGIKPERMVVIPHGIEAIPEQVAPFPEEFTVGYLGASGPDKGVKYLIDAWASLGWEFARLIIAGEGSQEWAHYIQSRAGKGKFCLPGFVPNVADFYNAITVYVQPSVCCAPGTPVITTSGATTIEQVQPGLKVLTRDGFCRPVTDIKARMYQGELVNIKANSFPQAIRLTPEHRVLCVRRSLETRRQNYFNKLETYNKSLVLHQEQGLGNRRIAAILDIPERRVANWIYYGSQPEGYGANHSVAEDASIINPCWLPAADLEKGDLLAIPRIKESERVAQIRVSDYVDRTTARYWQAIHSPRRVLLPEFLTVDDALLQFLGYYVAEGCASPRQVHFSFHRKEEQYIRDVRWMMEVRLGVHTRAYHRGNVTTVSSDNTDLAQLLGNLCGKGAHHKHPPAWLLCCPPDQIRPFLRGAWRGDGSVFITPKGHLRASYTTVSREFAQQVFMALVKLGFRAGVYPPGHGYSVKLAGREAERFCHEVLLEIPPIGYRHGVEKRHSGMDDDYYYLPIRDLSRENYSGLVYNLEVEGEPSYSVPWVVHNCEGFGIEVVEAMSYGRPVIASTGAGASDAIRAERGWLVPPGDIKMLAEALRQARATTPEILESMGDYSRNAARRYQWKVIRDEYRTVFRELVESRN